MSHLLDSVILIDHCNGFAAATGFIEAHAETHAISAITRAEVLAGFPESEWDMGVALLDSFRFLPMDVVVADEAAALRRRSRLKLPDAIQAAFAIVHGLKLATRNTRDFSRERFAFVVVPYELA